MSLRKPLSSAAGPRFRSVVRGAWSQLQREAGATGARLKGVPRYLPGAPAEAQATEDGPWHEDARRCEGGGPNRGTPSSQREGSHTRQLGRQQRATLDALDEEHRRAAVAFRVWYVGREGHTCVGGQRIRGPL